MGDGGTDRRPVHGPSSAATWTPRKNDQNNDSVILLLKEGSATAHLTGDIERAISVPDKVDVLKVPHHGSRGVQERPRATVRVMSVRTNNPFGHPHESAFRLFGQTGSDRSR
jgi:beta-lactamase superfamily II metal-dependent hydrolase